MIISNSGYTKSIIINERAVNISYLFTNYP